MTLPAASMDQAQGPTDEGPAVHLAAALPTASAKPSPTAVRYCGLQIQASMLAGTLTPRRCQ